MAFVTPNYADIYGRIINPAAYPGQSDQYLTTGQSLAQYYQRLLAAEGGNVERAKQRLMQDYQKEMRITGEDYGMTSRNLTEDQSRMNRIAGEDYTRNIAFGQESAAAARAEETQNAANETRATQADLLRRGVSQGGLADTSYSRLKSKQDLRREAIDRALRKSEEDLRYGKERALEETGVKTTRGLEEAGYKKTRAEEEATLKQTRGDVDVTKEYERFGLEQEQNRQDKGLSLTESAYQREFGKRATEEGFRLQEAALNR